MQFKLWKEYTVLKLYAALHTLKHFMLFAVPFFFFCTTANIFIKVFEKKMSHKFVCILHHMVRNSLSKNISTAL